MSYCFNPTCSRPLNPKNANFCLTCGSNLLLKARYRALRPIGEGGFSRTFLAVDADRLNASCAVKQFLPLPRIQGDSQAMAKAQELFEQEARQLLHLGEQHPQIPMLLAYFEQDKRLYLVQQFIDGEDLDREMQRQGAFSERQIREILGQMLPVLQFIHEHQVIHRDIKPTNIIRRRRDRQLVLIDFGIAKQLGEAGVGVTGTRAGTEGYAPLEQLRGGKAYPASDLYSLGVTCIHLLANAQLADLFDPLAGRWLWQEHLQQQGISISRQLAQILNKLLPDLVGDRYQSADAALRDLHLAAAIALPPKSQTWHCAVNIDAGVQVLSVAINRDRSLVASGGNDKTIRLWRTDSGTLQANWAAHEDMVLSVAFSPDGQTLASSSSDRTIKLWDCRQDPPAPIRTLKGHASFIKSVTFSPDGKLLASGSGDKTIKLWQAATGKLLGTLAGHSHSVWSVAFSPDGETLASGSWDATAKLWHLFTGNLAIAFEGHAGWVFAVAISPDGQLLASGGSDGKIRLWHLGSGKLLRLLSGHANWVRAIAISPNGQLLASGSADKTIKIWHLGTGTLQQTLIGHSKTVLSVAFSPDSRTLISGSTDGTIKFWHC